MLNEQDVELLLECVDSWKSSESMTNLVTSMITTAFAKTKQEKDAAIKKAGQWKPSRTRDERATLLKAKLIGLRDQLCVENVLNGEQ